MGPSGHLIPRGLPRGWVDGYHILRVSIIRKRVTVGKEETEIIPAANFVCFCNLLQRHPL